LKSHKWDEDLRPKEKNGHRLISSSQQRFFIHEIKVKSYPSSNIKICFQSLNYNPLFTPRVRVCKWQIYRIRIEKTTRFIFEHWNPCLESSVGDFIAIAGEMCRFPASNENTDSVFWRTTELFTITEFP
jgi:hypothetical protein